jgi:hypothetical protein
MQTAQRGLAAAAWKGFCYCRACNCLFNFDMKEIAMVGKTHLIEPENLGLWAAAAFILALLALIMSFVNLYRSNEMMAYTQMEIVMLHNKMVGTGAPATPDAAQEKK